MKKIFLSFLFILGFIFFANKCFADTEVINASDTKVLVVIYREVLMACVDETKTVKIVKLKFYDGFFALEPKDDFEYCDDNFENACIYYMAFYRFPENNSFDTLDDLRSFLEKNRLKEYNTFQEKLKSVGFVKLKETGLLNKRKYTLDKKNSVAILFPGWHSFSDSLPEVV